MTDPTHTFSVVYSIPGEDSLEPHLDALQEAGCDDAALMGPAVDGSFVAEFDRSAPSFHDAVVSALEAIRAAIPSARLLRVLPDDLVTISAIAARTGRTDESIRLLCQGKRGPGGFPPAAGRINEKTLIWRWADVARWFSEALDEPPQGADHAEFLAALNDALELDSLADGLREHPEEWAAIARFLPEDLATA